MVGPSGSDLDNMRYLGLKSKLTYQAELAEDYRIARNKWRLVAVWQFVMVFMAAMWRLLQ